MTYLGKNLSSLSSSCNAHNATPETPPIAAPQILFLNTISRVSELAELGPLKNMVRDIKHIPKVFFSQFIPTSMFRREVFNFSVFKIFFTTISQSFKRLDFYTVLLSDFNELKSLEFSFTD